MLKPSVLVLIMTAAWFAGPHPAASDPREAVNQKTVKSKTDFEIVLPVTHGTGLTWQAKIPEALLITSEKQSVSSTVPGSPGSKIFTLRAKTNGDFPVVFALGRPGAPPLESKKFIIHAH